MELAIIIIIWLLILVGGILVSTELYKSITEAPFAEILGYIGFLLACLLLACIVIIQSVEYFNRQ